MCLTFDLKRESDSVSECISVADTFQRIQVISTRRDICLAYVKGKCGDILVATTGKRDVKNARFPSQRWTQ